jgi:hypothetical protein
MKEKQKFNSWQWQCGNSGCHYNYHCHLQWHCVLFANFEIGSCSYGSIAMTLWLSLVFRRNQCKAKNKITYNDTVKTLTIDPHNASNGHSWLCMTVLFFDRGSCWYESVVSGCVCVCLCVTVRKRREKGVACASKERLYFNGVSVSEWEWVSVREESETLLCMTLCVCVCDR